MLMQLKISRRSKLHKLNCKPHGTPLLKICTRLPKKRQQTRKLAVLIRQLEVLQATTSPTWSTRKSRTTIRNKSTSSRYRQIKNSEVISEFFIYMENLKKFLWIYPVFHELGNILLNDGFIFWIRHTKPLL